MQKSLSNVDKPSKKFIIYNTNMAEKYTKNYGAGEEEPKGQSGANWDPQNNYGPVSIPGPPANPQMEEAPILNQILTGWGNYIKSHFTSLEPELQMQGEWRLSICHKCDMRNGGTCSTQKEGQHVVTGEMVRGCGCRLAAKALSPSSRCPLGKW